LDGVAAEEVLGASAFDPRSFAASWAAERGVIPSPVSRAYVVRRRSRVLPVAVAAAALIAIVGAVLVISASPGGRVRVAFPAGPPRVFVPYPGAVPHPRFVPVPRSIGPFFAVDRAGPDSGTRLAGVILLIVGLVGVVGSTVFWAWDGRSRRRLALGNGA
jgi:hypothetical protein